MGSVATGKPVGQKQVPPELREFLGCLTWQFSRPIDALDGLAADGGTVPREAFVQHAQGIGYPGDAGAVFDLLADGSGTAPRLSLPLAELRERLVSAVEEPGGESRS